MDTNTLEASTVLQDGKLYIKYKKPSGEEHFKPIGVKQDNGQAKYSFTEAEVPSLWDLMTTNKMAEFPDGCYTAKLTLESHPS